MLTFLLRPWAYLPLRVIHGLGAGLGWMIYWGSPRYAARMRENLRASKVCNSEQAYRKLLRQSIREAGKGVARVMSVAGGRLDGVDQPALVVAAGVHPRDVQRHARRGSASSAGRVPRTARCGRCRWVENESSLPPDRSKGGAVN